MKKKRLKLDFFAILHPLFLMMLGLIFYFFAFILIWFITELTKLIEGKTDFHTLYLYSLLISLACSVLLIMYVAGLIAQLIIHIQHQKERTLLPVWCMLTAVLMLVPLFEDFSILGSSWNFKGYFLSIVAYIAYLFTSYPRLLKVTAIMRQFAMRLGGSGLGIILSMFRQKTLSKPLRVLSSFKLITSFFKLGTYNKTIKTR
ncbi:MAG: hypothetical protein ACLT8V_02045 [Streptococcus salivarius]